MHSCQNSVMLSTTRRSALIFDRIRPVRSRSAQSTMRPRGLLGRISPKLVVKSSMVGSVIASGNVIAAAAAVANPGLHGAVSSAITQLAVSAVAIASGACLSTKVEFLWPKMEEQPGVLILDGVDVTGYPIFENPKVQEAIVFARKAHNGQFRKTGEPYLTHCIHTARIISMLVPSSGKRAVDTVVAGILHDVVDDTCESLRSIEEAFGDDVATMVAGVSRLSFINQIFVVDSTDRERIGTAKAEFQINVNFPLLPNCPILVLANKQDQKGAMTPREVSEELGLLELKDRKWHIQGTCAVTGDGLCEGLDWLACITTEMKNSK